MLPSGLQGRKERGRKMVRGGREQERKERRMRKGGEGERKREGRDG